MAKKNDPQKMTSEVPPVSDETPSNDWTESRRPESQAKTAASVVTSAPISNPVAKVEIPEFHTQRSTPIVVDVRRQGVEIKAGVFRLQRFIDGADYKDVLNNRWVWSIGRNVHDGRVEAAIDTRYYGDPNWECLFLR